MAPRKKPKSERGNGEDKRHWHSHRDSNRENQPSFPLGKGRISVGNFEWLGSDDILEEIADDLADRIDDIFRYAINNSVANCRAYNLGPLITLEFCDSENKVLFFGDVYYDKLTEPSSIRLRQPESMDAKDKDRDQTRLRPRWAEEARPKKQVKLRLEPDLISKVEDAAASKGMTRNDWIEESIRKALAAQKPKPK